MASGLVAVKAALCKHIEKNREWIGKTGAALLDMPELGFQEFRSSAFIADTLASICGRENITANLALTGIRATVDCGNAGGINVCLISELDAVTSSEHPHADPVTHAAHSCGHHAQSAAALGAFEALLNSGVMKDFAGKITYLAAPAEEFVELGYRKKLREAGKIGLLAGKPELIRLGVFDDIDAAMMVHAHNVQPAGTYYVGGSSLGFVAKMIEFVGKEAHAGASPFEGINALNAACAAMMLIHANRETFRDEDRIRVHPIITRGGDLVNIVPASVTMETYVRGASERAIRDAAMKVNRAIEGAAHGIGARARIETIPGYLPLFQDGMLSELFAENARALPATRAVNSGVDMTGSSDIGDLSHLLPTIQPTIGGFRGSPHTPDFLCEDNALVGAEAAKVLAMTAADLLANGGEAGLRLKAEFVPRMTKEAYLKAMSCE